MSYGSGYGLANSAKQYGVNSIVLCLLTSIITLTWLSFMQFFQLDRKNKDPEELLMLELLGNGGKVRFNLTSICIE